jgi:hypothetical protein
VEFDDGDSDLIGYVTDVESCEVTERELLSAGRPPMPEEGERQPSKAEQVEQIIRERFADGEERPSIYDELVAAGFTKTTIDRARLKLLITRKMPGAMHCPWMWRLRPEHVGSSNSANSCGSSEDASTSRGGSPTTDTKCVPSIENPNNKGRYTDTHRLNVCPLEGTQVHKSGDTPRVASEGTLAEQAEREYEGRMR